MCIIKRALGDKAAHPQLIRLPFARKLADILALAHSRGTFAALWLYLLTSSSRDMEVVGQVGGHPVRNNAVATDRIKGAITPRGARLRLVFMPVLR